jgi:hypothetical protein
MHLQPTLLVKRIEFFPQSSTFSLPGSGGHSFSLPATQVAQRIGQPEFVWRANGSLDFKLYPQSLALALSSLH